MTPVLACPHCGETKQVEQAGRQGFCSVCGKLWIVVPAPPRSAS
jgi:rRNA maturation protein Nop10